ncbi:MAG: fumarylacetoacetate hydrolase family protein [Chloroflexota bacterium]
MRLVRFFADDKVVREGAVSNDMIHEIVGSYWEPEGMGSAIVDLENVTLLPPCQPSKIVAIGRNYVAHAQEHNAPVPERPLMFLKPPSSLIGHNSFIVLPAESTRVEHEAELVIVMGKQTRNLSEDQVDGHILGYTLGNDVTARDLQRIDGQWTRSKGFDTFCPLGPWIDTEIDPTDLAIECRVNGELRQRGRTSQMVFSVHAQVESVSRVMTLLPGDIIMTGTPSGVAKLADGDTVTVWIENLGSLTNPVVRET